MTIEPGSQLLHYRVVEKIGEGGMGVVWRATDTTLDRDVALKVLPAALAADTERLARFEREAKLLASLNHPHVATIHGIHETDGLRFLTMELVEGEDLSDAIARGLSIDRAVEIAGEIAEALEAAHASGVVHRDLKPANVMLTKDRTVKVLDFGLAKALGVGAISGDSAAGPADTPTLTSAGTIAGVVLGTAAYMAPEQARGRPVDRRADLWAFGCLLYEMLTGKRAFEGETISDTIASVLKESPDLAALPEATPPAVRRLLRRCLAKDPRKRLADAADARIELREAFEAPRDGEVASTAAAVAEGPAPRARMLPWLLAAAPVVIAVAATLALRDGADADRALLSLAAPVPEGIRIDDDQTSNMALAPDGAFLVFTGLDETGLPGLYLRHLDSNEVVRLDGTDAAENPFVSPDGKWIGFFVGPELRKVSVSGGSPIRVAGPVGAVRGASWGEDDRIVLTSSFESPLSWVPGSGGELQPLTELDDARRERTHRWPQTVPGHDVVLFTVATKDSPEYYGDARIDAVRPSSGERKTVFEGASFARYADTGHLVFGRDGALWAVPFDIDRLELTGTPQPVVQNVMGARNSGVVYADVSRNGLLAYVRGLPEDPTAILTWRGLDGSSRPLDGAPIGGYGDVALSPDGRKVAVSLLGDTSFDIWVYDIERSIPIRLTFEGDNTGPIWTPDGRSILFYSVREGVGAAYRKAADGSGTETVVATEEGVTVLPEHISPDGRTAILSYYREFKGDLYLFPLDEDGGEATPLLTGPGDQINARFSPDGRWIAYVTDESGLFQVMVRPSSGDGGRWQISRDGGVTPRWSPDGRKLFYRNGRRLLSVAVEADAGSFRASPPQAVLDDLVRSNLAASYAVGPDGESILIAESNDAAGPPDEFTVVVNWLDELARQVPAER